MGFCECVGVCQSGTCEDPMVGSCPNTPQRRRHPIGVTQGRRRTCAFPQEKEGGMNLFTIIGIVVVVLFIAGYLGFR